MHDINKTCDDVERYERLLVNSKSEISYELVSRIDSMCDNTSTKLINIDIVIVYSLYETFKINTNDCY